MGGMKGGGKGGGSPDTQASAFETAMAGMANELYAQSKPLRKAFLEDYGSFIRPGGYGISNIPDYYSTPAQPRGYGQGAIADYYTTPGSLYPSGSAGIPSSTGTGVPSIQDIINYQASQNNPVRQTYNQTSSTPVFGQSYSGGKYNPYALPGYAPLYQLARGGVESQYNQARSNILGSTPRGGALGENLANLEMSRAQTAGALPAQIASPLIQSIMGQAYQAAFGAPAQSISGMGGAANAYNQQYASDLAYQAQQQNAANQGALGLGAGLGSLLSLGFKAPQSGSIFSNMGF